MSNRRRSHQSHKTPGSGGGGGVQIVEVGLTAVDQTAELGDENETLSHIAGTLSGQDLGDIADSYGVTSFKTVTVLGGESESYSNEVATGELTVLLGSDGQVLAVSTDGTFDSIPLGSMSEESFSADSTIFAQQHGVTALRSGTDWQDIVNAQGQGDSSFAYVEAANTLTAGDSYTGYLSLGTYGMSGISEPSGFTRNTAVVKVRQAYKVNLNALDLISTLSHNLLLRTSAGVNLTTLESWNDNSADRTFATVDSYPISDAFFVDSDHLRFSSTCTLQIGAALTSSCYWRVWWAAIEITYTRTGIT